MATFKDSYTKSWACKFRYRNWQGETKQHKKTGFKTQKEAKEYEKAFLDREKNSCDMTMQSLFDYYIADCKARLKPRSVVTKEFNWRLHSAPFFAKKKVNEVTPADIRKWQTEQINSGKFEQNTLIQMHIQLSALFTYAVKVYGLAKNPCSIAGNFGRSKTSKDEYWTVEEFNCFLNAVKDDIEQEAVFTLLFYSGMRIGEVQALTIDDFDFAKNTVTISKTYQRLERKDVIGPPKTEGSRRTITLPPSVMAKVREYHFTLYDKGKANRLFFRSQECYLRWLKRGAQRAGVKLITLHSLRHSHASLLINMGTPIKQISERLGHDNVKTTLTVYAHMYKERETEMITMLESFASAQNG